MSEHIPQLSMSKLRTLINAAFEANTVVCVMGPPGVGKSAMAAQLTEELSRRKGHQFSFVPIEAGLIPVEEMGGLAMKLADGRVIRAPLSPIHQACVMPSVLFLDEITRCNKDKLGLLLTGIQDRRFGDARLHPETRILLAGNYGESGGIHGLIDAFINRVCLVGLKADAEGFLDWLQDVPQGSMVAPNHIATREDCEIFMDFAATARRAPNLVSFEVPEGVEEQLLSWASPRAIVNGLITYRHLAGTGHETDDVGRAVLGGFIGLAAATAYLTIRAVRDRLASIDEILKDPETAKIPKSDDIDAGIAALGVIAVVTNRDADAAVRYAARMETPELRSMLIRSRLLKFENIKTTKGREAYALLVKAAGSALQRSKMHLVPGQAQV